MFVNWLQKERDREDRELSGVKLQAAQEVQTTGDGCVGGRATQRGHHLPAARFAELLKELDEFRPRSVLEEAESNSTIQQTTKEFSY